MPSARYQCLSSTKLILAFYQNISMRYYNCINFDNKSRYFYNYSFCIEKNMDRKKKIFSLIYKFRQIWYNFSIVCSFSHDTNIILYTIKYFSKSYMLNICHTSSIGVGVGVGVIKIPGPAYFCYKSYFLIAIYQCIYPIVIYWQILKYF